MTTEQMARWNRVARELMAEVNGPGVEGLAEVLASDHRTLQQSLMRELVLPLLREWAEAAETERYDLRNEGTVKAAAVMVAAFDEAQIYLPFV